MHLVTSMVNLPPSPKTNSAPASWAQYLANSSLELHEARILLEFVSRKNRSWHVLHGDELVPHDIAQRYQELSLQRQSGVPLAYVMGEREFYGLTFSVSSATLIPRADTEVLVDWLITNIPRHAKLLELGTGTGCIAIATAVNRPDIRWVATDISTAALTVAQRNAQQLGVTTHIQFVKSDWYSTLEPHSYSGIVSNPPYIAANDVHLTAGDLIHEPKSALTDGYDGLNAFRAITKNAKQFLVSNGFIALEHGYGQGQALRALLEDQGFSGINTHLDLEQRDRFTVAKA